MKKFLVTACLSSALLFGGVGSAFAATDTTPAPSNGLGNIFDAVNQLIGSTNVSVESGVNLHVGDVSVQASAVNANQQTGLTGLLSGGVLGGTIGTSASASYAGYSASTSANGSWGLASTAQAIGGLLNSLGQALGK